MPDAAANAFQELTAEFKAGQTIEAQVARDADKLETLLQAVEYQAQGHDTTAWQETSIAALRTEAAKQLAKPSVQPTLNGGRPSPLRTASCVPAPKDAAEICAAERSTRCRICTSYRNAGTPERAVRRWPVPPPLGHGDPV